MVNKTSIKIDSELNRQLAIIALLEKIKKEVLINDILVNGLKDYQKKYNKYKFK